jgi:high-affinity nickel-transport protein
MTPLAALGLGFVLGMRHATDVDHVAAVSAMAGRERSLRGALSLGTLWGIGHTATVLVAGGVIVAFGLAIPERLGLSLEMLVAAMLVVLGMLNFSSPPHTRDHGHKAPLARPVLVGVVHGLAGSAAVALLALTTIREPLWAFGYLLVFGLGTILGMALFTATLTLPLAVAAKRFERADRYVVRALGLVSIAVGIALAYRVGFVDGLFLAEPLAAK